MDAFDRFIRVSRSNSYYSYVHMDPDVRTLAVKLELSAQRAAFAGVLDIVSGLFSYNLHLFYGAPVGLLSLLGVFGASSHNLAIVNAFIVYQVMNICLQLSLLTTLYMCYTDKDVERSFEKLVKVNMVSYHYTVGIFFLFCSALYKLIVTYLYLRLRHDLSYAILATNHLLSLRRRDNHQ